MDNTTALFIRACKSKNPTKRLMSVHRRFYFDNKEHPSVNISHVIGILSDIVDEYLTLCTGNLLAEVLGHNFFIAELPLDERVRATLMYSIRHAKVNKFVGLPTPSRFKKDNQL
jgi:hypothetical protein